MAASPSPASVAILTAASRRFLSLANHHRAPAPATNTLLEPQRTYSLAIMPEGVVLPPETAFLQLSLFDLHTKEPLGLPQRFKVNEAREISTEAFGEYFARGMHSDRLFLVFEAVAINEEPSPDRPFREECQAFGWYPLGLKATDKKQVVEITLHRGSANGYFSSPNFRAGHGQPSTNQMGSLTIAAWCCGKAKPADAIFPAYRFVSAHSVPFGVVSGRDVLNTMKVSVESFSIRYGDGRSGAESAAVANSTWSLALMTHSGYKNLSQTMATTNLSQYENMPNVFRTGQPIDVDAETPIHQSSTLVLVLRRQTDAGPLGVAVAALPLCPKPSAVKDAIVRVSLLPFLNGPFHPTLDAPTGTFVSSAASGTLAVGGAAGASSTTAATMFSRSDWSCSLILKIENTPNAAAAPRRGTGTTGAGRMTKQQRLLASPSASAAAPPVAFDSPSAGRGDAAAAGDDLVAVTSGGGSVGGSGKRPTRPKQPRPPKALPVPQFQDFSEEPMLNATPEALREQQQQQLMLRQQQQQQQQRQNKHAGIMPQEDIYEPTSLGGGGHGGDAAANAHATAQMAKQLDQMRGELTSALKEISQEVGVVKGELGVLSRAQRAKSKLDTDPISIMQGSAHGILGARRDAPNANNGRGGGVRVADAPIARAQTALSTRLRSLILDRQHPIRHPISQQPLAPETVLCSTPLIDTRFCIRVNGITIRNVKEAGNDRSANAQQQQSLPKKFSFRVSCGLAIQATAQPHSAGTIAAEAPLPALTAATVATSESGEALYALRLDPQDAQSYATHHAAHAQQGGDAQHHAQQEDQDIAAAAQSGHWLEPAAPSDVHLQAAVPAYVRRLRKERQSLLFSTVPAAVTIEVLDGYSRFPIGYATLPLEAFQRPPTTTHTVKEEDVVIRSESAFWRDSTGSVTGPPGTAESVSGESPTCPANRPFVGVLHVTACAIGYKALDLPAANGGGGNGGASGMGMGMGMMGMGMSSPSVSGMMMGQPTTSSGSAGGNASIGMGSPRASGCALVEVPKLMSSSSAATPPPPGSSGNGGVLKPHAPNASSSGGNMDGSSFLTSARLSHLHSKRVECLKASVLAGASTPRGTGAGALVRSSSGSDLLLSGGGAGADRIALDFQNRVLERQRDERKQDKIQDALFKRMQSEATCVVPSGRPAVVDFAFKNPYPATMAFTIEFVKNHDAAALVLVEAAAGFGHSFLCGPLEEKTIQVCVRARHTSVARCGTPGCQTKCKVLDDKGECVKILHCAATVIPPQVDRVLQIYGGPGATVNKDIFLRCFDQNLVVNAENGSGAGADGKASENGSGGVGLSKLNGLVQRLCSFIRCGGDDQSASAIIKRATTGANIQYLYDGAVATWEELFLSVIVPSVPTISYVHIYGDELQQNCLMTWALRVAPVTVYDSQPILCGQMNLITLPMAGMKNSTLR